jgi:hypothetical protein
VKGEDMIEVLDRQLAPDDALQAATLGQAIELRGQQWQTAAPAVTGLALVQRDACWHRWMDGNAAVLAHWGQAPRAGLTEDPAAMALPNPAHADPA